MVIFTDDINEAFIVFETLNARGKELETSDLLKNFVFMQSGSNIESVKSKWIKMIDLLEKDDRVQSVLPQIHKSNRPFVGVVIVCQEHKYCIPLGHP